MACQQHGVPTAWRANSMAHVNMGHSAWNDAASLKWRVLASEWQALASAWQALASEWQALASEWQAL
eukprot:65413-Chlamydomonas_euryale.AAC.1